MHLTLAERLNASSHRPSDENFFVILAIIDHRLGGREIGDDELHVLLQSLAAKMPRFFLHPEQLKLLAARDVGPEIPAPQKIRKAYFQNTMPLNKKQRARQLKRNEKDHD